MMSHLRLKKKTNSNARSKKINDNIKEKHAY